MGVRAVAAVVHRVPGGRAVKHFDIRRILTRPQAPYFRWAHPDNAIVHVVGHLMTGTVALCGYMIVGIALLETEQPVSCIGCLALQSDDC